MPYNFTEKLQILHLRPDATFQILATNGCEPRGHTDFGYNSMKGTSKTNLLLFLIGLLVLNLCSCASKEPHLAIDASIISKGQTKLEVKNLVGEPDYITHNEKGEEEWYYYNDITPFWRRIWLVGRLFGKKRIEAIQVTFYHDHVSKVIYYVSEK